MRNSTKHHADLGARIVGIAQSTEASSIGLIAAVDGTVKNLTGISEIMAGASKVVGSAIDEIKALKTLEGDYLDPDDLAIAATERTEAVLDGFLRKLVLKRAAIDADARLKDHHAESLHDAYELAMNETAMLVEALADFRAAIITHDLAAEPRDGPVYESVEELIAALRAGS